MSNGSKRLQPTLNVLLTAAQRRVVADLLPTLADRLKLDEKNPRTVSFTAKELESIRQKAEAARPNADNVGEVSVASRWCFADCFAGSGTMLLAGLDYGASKVIGIEREKKYLKIAEKRVCE
jgi:predicted RNA methylase